MEQNTHNFTEGGIFKPLLTFALPVLLALFLQAMYGAVDLRAYAIDCMLTPIFFCFIGYYNGIGMTRFVMLQGIVSAFCVRVPVSFLMSRRKPVSLFHIGLATPASSTLQIIMGLCGLIYVRRRIVRNSGHLAEGDLQ